MTHVKRPLWILLIIIGALLLLIFNTQWITQSWLCHKIEKTLQRLDTVHHVTIKNVGISFLTSSITLHGIEIQTDTIGKIFNEKDSLDFIAIGGEISDI